MATCLISLGANLGDRVQTLHAAIASLERSSQIHILAHSRWSETTPAGGPPQQADFLNGAALLETTLSPRVLLAQLQHVENKLGRRREVRWGARSIDLDLLLYDDVVVASPQLTLPHPRLAFRRFVLAPCLEIAPQWVHPLIGWSLEECFAHLQQTPRYVAVTGCSPGAVNAVAQLGAQQADAFFIADPVLPGKEWRNAEALRHPDLQRSLVGRLANIIFGKWRAKALADAAVEQDEWVSGFWLEQSCVAADVWSPSKPPRFDPASRDWFTAAPQPALVVWLDETGSDANAQPESGVGENMRQYNRALGRRVMRRERGPWLQLPAADRNQAANEVAAALLAMRPE